MFWRWKECQIGWWVWSWKLKLRWPMWSVVMSHRNYVSKERMRSSGVRWMKWLRPSSVVREWWFVQITMDMLYNATEVMRMWACRRTDDGRLCKTDGNSCSEYFLLEEAGSWPIRAEAKALRWPTSCADFVIWKRSVTKSTGRGECS